MEKWYAIRKIGDQYKVKGFLTSKNMHAFIDKANRNMATNRTSVDCWEDWREHVPGGEYGFVPQKSGTYVCN